MVKAQEGQEGESSGWSKGSAGDLRDLREGSGAGAVRLAQMSSGQAAIHQHLPTLTGVSCFYDFSLPTQAIGSGKG